MSYILDALRRADSERERGSVPGLHTQPVSLALADDSPPRGARPWVWLVAGSLLLLLGALAWFLLARQTLPADRMPLASASAVPVPAAPTTPTPLALPTAPVTSVSPAASSSAVPVALPIPAPSVRKPALRPAPAVVNAKVPKPSAKVQAAASAPVASAPALAPAFAKDARIYTLNELPDEVRKDLPALLIGGAMYSQSAANRMLIVNGHLFHEGDTLAPGLMLEQIKLRSAVLRLKGYRYGISF